MVSQQLKETLDRYHVGDKIKQLRLRRKMGLVELSRHTGLSPALLSKLEHGKLYPTLPTLSRIGMVFSMGLDFFFIDKRQRHTFALVRKKIACASRKPRNSITPLLISSRSISWPPTANSTRISPTSAACPRHRSTFTSIPA